MKLFSAILSFAMLFSNVGMKASNLVEVYRQDFNMSTAIPNWNTEAETYIDLLDNARVLVVGSGNTTSTTITTNGSSITVLVDVEVEDANGATLTVEGDTSTSHSLENGVNSVNITDTGETLLLTIENNSGKNIIIKSLSSLDVEINNGDFKKSILIPGFNVTQDHILIKNQTLELHDLEISKGTTVRSLPIPIDGTSHHKISFDLEVIQQSHGVEIGVNYLDGDNNSLTYKNVLLRDKAGTGRFIEDFDLPVVAGTQSIQITFNSGAVSLTEANFFGYKIYKYTEEVENEIFDSILNPGFEDGLDNWEAVYENEPFSTSSTTVKSGAHSLYFQDLQSEGPNDVARILSNKVKVEQGKNYLLSAEVNVETQSHSIVLVAEYYDINNKLLKAYEELFSSNTLGTNKWNTIRKMSTAPEGAAYVRVGFYSGKPSITKAYFDDVTFELVDNSETLEREYNSPINLGPMVDVGLGQAGAIGVNSKGESEVYFISNGSPGTFYVLDAITGEAKFSEVIPNTIAVWAITIGKDKNVYFGGTEDGRLYRYLPDKKIIEDLGSNPADKWIWDLEVSDDGSIYGTTYPNAKLFKYDPILKSFEDLGRMHETQEYARGLGIDGDNIYIGIGTQSKHLIKYSISSDTTKEVSIPELSGTTGTFEDITVIGDYLFISNGTINMLVVHKDTLQVVGKFQYSNRIGYNENIDSNHVYYKFEKDFFRFNLLTLKEENITIDKPLPDTVRTKDVQWVLHDGEYKIALLTQYGEYMLINPENGKVDMISLDISLQPVDIQSLEVGFDGRLYMGGYQRGLSIYDPFTNNIDVNLPNFAQPEGIGFLNNRVWYGTYVGAIMYSLDPSKDINLDNNPNYEYKIQDNQDRPFAITSGDDKLFVGTIPDYGMLGGVLAIYDEPSNTWNQFRNVVKDQSIISLAYKDGLLYGGTSVWGGLGSDPTAKEAEMFIWDVENEQMIKSFTLDIPNIDEKPRMIGELKFDENGLLWGVVDGTIFAYDIETESVVKSKMIEPSTYNSSKWFPYRIQFAPDGMIYSTISRKLVAIDPETLDHKVIVDQFMNNMTLGVDGSIYYSHKSELFKIEIKETDATLSDIKFNGVSIPEFSSGQLNYTLKQDKNMRLLDEIVVTTSQDDAKATITSDAQVYTIKVVGPDGVSTLTYTVNVEYETENPEEPLVPIDPPKTVDPSKPVDPTVPLEPTDPDKPITPPTNEGSQNLPGTGMAGNYYGLVILAIGCTVILLSRRKKERI